MIKNQIKSIFSLPFLLLILGASSLGFSPILVRYSVLGPIGTALWRLIFALPFVFLIYKINNKEIVSNKNIDIKYIFLAGLFFSIDLIFYNFLVDYTFVANTTILGNFSLFFVILGSVFVFKKRLNKSFYIGIIIAFTGSIILLGKSYTLSVDHILGDLFALVSALAYGAYILTLKKLRESYSIKIIMLFASISSAIVILIGTIIMKEQFVPNRLIDFLPLIGLALICHVFGHTILTYSLAYLPASFVAVTLLLQIVVAVILAWILFEESIGLIKFIGGAIIFMGILISRKSINNENSKQRLS